MDSYELGEEKLRDEFQQSYSDEAKYEDFLKRYSIASLAETYWINKYKTQDLAPHPPQESQAVLSDLRDFFAFKPYDLPRLYSGLTNYLSLSTERPIEFIASLKSVAEAFLPPLFLSFILFLLVYLTKWLPALKRDLLNFLGTDQRFFPLMIFILVLGLSLWTQQWGLLLIILLGAAYLYSRIKTLFVTALLLSCLSLSLMPLWSSLYQNAEKNLAVEALREGRNKLAYTPEALNNLNAWQRSAWSLANNDTTEARFWSAGAEPSLESKMIEINLDFRPSKVEESLKAYEKLNDSYPNNQLVQFNLIQLYTRVQDLVSADEFREKIGKNQYDQLLELKERGESSLLLPRPTNTLKGYLLQSLSDFTSKWKYDSWQKLFFYLNHLLPWLIFCFCFILRKRVSGLCSETGVATKNYQESYSHLALQILQKQENLDPSLRQRYSKLKRHYLQERIKMIQVLSWLFPASRDVWNWRPLPAVLKTFFVYSLVWLALPSSVRSSSLQDLGWPMEEKLSASNLSIGLLIAGIIFYLYISWRSREKADT